MNSKMMPLSCSQQSPMVPAIRRVPMPLVDWRLTDITIPNPPTHQPPENPVPVPPRMPEPPPEPLEAPPPTDNPVPVREPPASHLPQS